MKPTAAKAPRTYELNDKPPVRETIPLCLQHVLLFLASTLAIPLIIGSTLGFSSSEITLMLQCSIFIAGIGTLLQTLGAGPVGNRLPIILGATFTFVTPAIAISQTYGFPAFIGASLVCGVAVSLLGAVSVKFIRKIFPPVAMGCVIMVIGLTLVGVAVGYCAGGSGSPDYGSLRNYGVALFTLVIVIVLNAWGKGFWKGASVLIALLAGFLLSAALGMVDFSSLNESAWFAFPEPLHFGITFKLPAIIMALLTLVNLVEFLGDTSTVAFIAADRVATKEDLSRGVICDGVASILGALFNSTPTISYSGNIGLIGVTGVKSRYVVAAARRLYGYPGLHPQAGRLPLSHPHSGHRRRYSGGVRQHRRQRPQDAGTADPLRAGYAPHRGLSGHRPGLQLHTGRAGQLPLLYLRADQRHPRHRFLYDHPQPHPPQRPEQQDCHFLQGAGVIFPFVLKYARRSFSELWAYSVLACHSDLLFSFFSYLIVNFIHFS